jgi:hypothetical protein
VTRTATDDEERGSVVATVRDRIKTGVDMSRVGRTTVRVRERCREAVAAVGTAASRSVVAGVGSSLHRGYETSRLAAAGAAVSTWVRNSRVYGWLTAEPEPDVIVVDLRETWTVGPVIGVLDRVVPRAASAARESTVWAVTERVYGAAARPLSGSRIVRWCVAALEPPEPAAETNGESTERGDSGSSAEEDGDASNARNEGPSDGGDAARNE